MQYIVYRTICLATGKVYYGVHGTDNLDDGYLGSGKFLLLAIKKYGRHNFTRQVICTFSDRNSAFIVERDLVTLAFLKRKDTYNCHIGGYGGGNYITPEGIERLKKFNYQRNEAIRLLRKQNSEYDKDYFLKFSCVNKGKCSGRVSPFKAKQHTPSSKIAIGSKTRITSKGSRNSQYGTCWIHSRYLGREKKIKLLDLATWLAKDWIKGRIKDGTSSGLDTSL